MTYLIVLKCVIFDSISILNLFGLWYKYRLFYFSVLYINHYNITLHHNKKNVNSPPSILCSLKLNISTNA